MGIIAKVGTAIQQLLISIAVVTGAKSQIIDAPDKSHGRRN